MSTAKRGLLNSTKKAMLISQASGGAKAEDSVDVVNNQEKTEQATPSEQTPKKLVIYGRVTGVRSKKNVKVNVLDSVQVAIDSVADGNDQGIYNKLLMLGLEKLDEIHKENGPLLCDASKLE